MSTSFPFISSCLTTNTPPAVGCQDHRSREEYRHCTRLRHDVQTQLWDEGSIAVSVVGRRELISSIGVAERRKIEVRIDAKDSVRSHGRAVWPVKRLHESE